MDPEFTAALNNSGFVKFVLKNYEGAIVDFSKAIELVPNAKSYFGRGLAYMGIDSLDNAKSDFSEGIALQPNSPRAFYYRGGVHYNLGEYSLAIDDYTRAIALKNDYAYAYNDRGSAYLMVDKIEEVENVNEIVQHLHKHN